ncbi:MAG TPA: hypothetical protein VFC00_26615 [Micromonosporaceae bacterium]|nr:hypothetical protein [Micromonosporaceae bacterium]
MTATAIGLGVLTGLLLLLVVLVALRTARTLRGRTQPGFEVRTEVHTPPPEIRIEELADP